MRSAPFLAVFKWTVLTVISTGVISTGAILWVSFDGLAHQPPAFTVGCPSAAIPARIHSPHVDAVQPQPGCHGWASIGAAP